MRPVERHITLLFRLLMAWTFLYSASHQVLVPNFSVVGFLNSTKTFHAVFVLFTTPTLAPIASFLVEWRHTLLGRSLLVGGCTRLSSCCGIWLLLMYWMAHMDFPYIENHNNFIVDYHVLYSVVLASLILYRAGHVFGLDGWAARLPVVRASALLRWAVQAD